jgi:hypothetical protein
VFNEENHTTRPYISLCSVVTFPVNDFWRQIGRSATHRVEKAILPPRLPQRAQPKIRNFEIAILVEKEILWLYVPVKHPSAMAEINGPNQLLKILACHVFLELPFGNLVEELSTFHVLHGKINLGFTCHDFIELDRDLEHQTNTVITAFFMV